MRALILMSQFYRLGGAERLSIELAEGLNGRPGITADVASVYTRELPMVAEVEKELLGRGIPAVLYLGLKVHPRPLPFLLATLRLRRLIKKNRYDVVETSMIGPTIMAAWATRGLATKHVAGVHDIFTKDRHDGAIHKVWRYSVKKNRSTRFYAVSDYARRFWLEYSATPPEHTRTIYNGIPDDCFEVVNDREAVRTELEIPSTARIALFVGRMLMRKGIDTLLEALGPISEERNIWLVYVGSWEQPPEGFYPGEHKLLERMKDRIISGGWARRVLFLGWRKDVPRLMASSDVLVHPARIEGFGLTLIEAMATGLPVVASNVNAIPEVLGDSGSVTVPPNDPEALRNAVVRILERSRPEVELAATRGRIRADKFRMHRRVQGISDMFHDVLADLGS